MKNGTAGYPFHRHGRPRKGETAFLATHGISKRLSMQAQALAGLPVEIQEDVANRRMSLTEAVKLFHLARRIVLAETERASAPGLSARQRKDPVMNVKFLISLEIDPEAVELEGRRAGLALGQAQAAILADVENRLHDAARFRAGIQRVGITLVEPPARPAADVTTSCNPDVAPRQPLNHNR